MTRYMAAIIGLALLAGGATVALLTRWPTLLPLTAAAALVMALLLRRRR